MPRDGERGFSLAELLASVALIAIALVGAWDLLDDALHLTDAASRGLRDPSFASSGALVRADIHAATSVPGPSTAWSRSPLELEMADGRVVVWERRRDSLYRVERSGRTATGTRRMVPIDFWRWRVVAPGLVEVRVGLSVSEDPLLSSSRPDPQSRAQRVRRTEAVWAAVRGANGGRSW